MGIIKAAINAVGGGLADSWLEVIEASPMGDNTLICPGQLVSQNGKSQNKKGSENIVSNGSVTRWKRSISFCTRISNGVVMVPSS